MTTIKKLLRTTCGLNACRLTSTGDYAAPKMTRIECYEVPAGVLCCSRSAATAWQTSPAQ